MFGVHVRVVQWNPRHATRIAEYSLAGEAASQTGRPDLTLVRLDHGEGAEHWAPTLPYDAPLPAGTTVAMWSPPGTTGPAADTSTDTDTAEDTSFAPSPGADSSDGSLFEGDSSASPTPEPEGMALSSTWTRT
ncbi:hypothetical protein [Streptomyces violaceorubidus]|uniref:hypothetical protein n=1 Tax=Streptomyces violaceorubidus TaxID=284042 RepID=UPI0004BEC38B|nr:hypothetical protein [Streptomyces violaceorubidus]